ncbi:DUF2752 domain-containing protein [Streptosporangium sp. NPDC023615]|uniref:DUF2752 domain-containing protein n=1 Tax=Streptosporangium sp. NPDC023615 TaxID=3154794 RepID=UPI0034220AAE
MPTSRAARSRVAVPVSLGIAAAAAVAFVAAVDPNEPGHYPPCPFLVLTGLYCPGCGGLRAVHALAHGDPPAALGLNPLVVILIPVVVALWGRWTLRVWRDGAAVVTDGGAAAGGGGKTGTGMGGEAGTGARAGTGGIAGPSSRKSVQPAHGWLLLTLVLAFWIVRNLPFGEFLAP